MDCQPFTVTRAPREFKPLDREKSLLISVRQSFTAGYLAVASGGDLRCPGRRETVSTEAESPEGKPTGNRLLRSFDGTSGRIGGDFGPYLRRASAANESADEVLGNEDAVLIDCRVLTERLEPFAADLRNRYGALSPERVEASAKAPSGFIASWPVARLYACRMPYPKHLLSSGEEVIKDFRPHWQAILAPMAILIAAVALAVLAGIYMEGNGRLVAWGGIALLWLILSLRPWLNWFFTQYVITNERLIFRTGILARRGKEIPMDVVNDVEFSKSFFERLIGSGDLLIESAGEYGQSRFTDIPHPERMQTLIYTIREDRKIAMESGRGVGVGEELETLARLKDQGVLTEAEFEAQKRKLLES